MVFCNLEKEIREAYEILSHNPYFNRWFSAISSFQDYHNAEEESQSLF